MTATLTDPITMLKRTPARIDRDRTDRSPDGGTDGGGYSRRNQGTPDDGYTDVPGADAPPRAARPRSGFGADRAPRRCGAPSYAAALVDIVPVLPTVGTIFTVFAYVGGPVLIAGQSHQAPLLIGGAAALLIGLITACLHRSFFTAAEHAHPRSFAEIRQRVDGLAVQISVLDAEMTPAATTSQRLAFEEAVTHYRALEQDLVQGGSQWIVGTGYVDAMTRLHRADETLILVQPAETVLAGALFDEVRIAGSTMADRDRLLEKLRAAVQSLRPSATVYLNEPPRDREPQAGRAQPMRATAATGQPANTPIDAFPAAVPSTLSPSAEIEARIVLREVRRALNDFRDESRAGLIRSRGRLLGTMTMTGIITYVLLAFAVSLEEVHTVALNDPIAAAAAIYLVGAVVGLFNRLYIESGDDAAGEDYDLSKTRLLLTPMLSGLAAVGGVLIMGMLSGIVDVNAVTPTPAVAADLGSKAFELGPDAQITRGGLSLHDIFNLQQYPFALVLAAIFGLTPKTFLKRLQRAGEQSRLDLKSTAAHQPVGSSQGGPSASDKV